MRIGMSLTSGYSNNRDSQEIMETLIDEVELMAELGFASLSLGDHHVTTSKYMQVLPTMSRLSAYSGDMQLIPLFLLPFYNPILLAEQVATLDVITNGRTAVICSLGHQPEAHDAFQTPQRLRVSRFTETFEIMRQLWDRDNVSFSGKHYSFENVSINPKPVSQHLPMWIGAQADPAIRRAAQIADAWVLEPGWTPDVVQEKLGFYRNALNEFGRADQISEIILRRDLHLAPTSGAAHREAQTLFERGYRGFSPEALEQSLIVGDADTCIRYLERMSGLGITEVLFRCALDDKDNAMQTIRVLGDVIAHFS